MAKRRLSSRQKQRIEQRKSSHINDCLEMKSDHTYQPATVVTNYGQHLDVALNHDLTRIVRCVPRTNLGALVVGDEVLIESLANNNAEIEYAIVALLPRASLLERPDPYGKLKPVAANADEVIIVLAPAPKPSTLLLDRYLAATELANLKAAIVLNKMDLWSDSHTANWQLFQTRYAALGYPVFLCSAYHIESLTLLKNHLKLKKSVVVGQSGVGKSSLINLIAPDALQGTREISEKSALGQHTTTLSKLFALPEGGFIMDSPGIREFGLWHINAQDLIQGFPEFYESKLRCKFNDCSHHNEPGCFIQSGLANGALSEERWQNYQSILASLEQNL